MFSSFSDFALPVGIGVAALAVGGLIVHTVMANKEAEAVEALSEADHAAKLKQDDDRMRQRRDVWRRRLVAWSLVVSFVLAFVIAAGAGWLSFGNQKQYALGANGGDDTAATVFALLLDAGALVFSLMRLFEAISARSSNLTRLGLASFIAGSTVMNLLHAHHAPGQAPSLGAILYVVIPPLVYAALLEMLLWKAEQLVLGIHTKRKRRNERGYSLWMWAPWPIGFPIKLWKKLRQEMRRTLDDIGKPVEADSAELEGAPETISELSAHPGAAEPAPVAAVGAPAPAPIGLPAGAAQVPAHLAVAEAAPIGAAHFEGAPHPAPGAPVGLDKEVRRAAPIEAAHFEGAPQETSGATQGQTAASDGVEPLAVLVPAHPLAWTVQAAAHPVETPAHRPLAPAQAAAHPLSVTPGQAAPGDEIAPEPVPVAEPVEVLTAAPAEDGRARRVAVRLPEVSLNTAASSKKAILKDALIKEIHKGDLRIFSDDPEVSNAVAYALNKKLFADDKPVTESTVRRYVKELLPDLVEVRASLEASRSADADVVESTEGDRPDADGGAPTHGAVGDGADDIMAAFKGAPVSAHLGADESAPLDLAHLDDSPLEHSGADIAVEEEVRRAAPIEAAHFEGAPQGYSGAADGAPEETDGADEGAPLDPAAHLGAPSPEAAHSDSAPLEDGGAADGALEEAGGADEGAPLDPAAHPGAPMDDEPDGDLVIGSVVRQFRRSADEMEYAHSL